MVAGDRGADGPAQPESPESWARRLLELVAAGDEIDYACVLGLAAAVLAREEVVLAMQVLAGGAYALDRALALAGVVLRGEPLLGGLQGAVPPETKGDDDIDEALALTTLCSARR